VGRSSRASRRSLAQLTAKVLAGSGGPHREIETAPSCITYHQGASWRRNSDTRSTATEFIGSCPLVWAIAVIRLSGAGEDVLSRFQHNVIQPRASLPACKTNAFDFFSLPSNHFVLLIFATLSDLGQNSSLIVCRRLDCKTNPGFRQGIISLQSKKRVSAQQNWETRFFSASACQDLVLPTTTTPASSAMVAHECPCGAPGRSRGRPAIELAQDSQQQPCAHRHPEVSASSEVGFQIC